MYRSVPQIPMVSISATPSLHAARHRGVFCHLEARCGLRKRRLGSHVAQALHEAHVTWKGACAGETPPIPPILLRRHALHPALSFVCFRRARVNLDFPWPTVILMKETR